MAVILGGSLAAQSTYGIILGTVQDCSGAVIAGARQVRNSRVICRELTNKPIYRDQSII